MGVFDKAEDEANVERGAEDRSGGAAGENVGVGGVGTPPEAEAAAGPTEASRTGSGPAPAAGESGPGAAEDRAGLGMEVTEGEGLGSSAVSGEDMGGFDVGAARLDDTSGAKAPSTDLTGGDARPTGGDAGAEADVPESLRAGVAAGAREGVAGAEDVAGVDQGPATIPTDTTTEDDGSSFDPTGAVSDAAESGQDNGLNS
ncbi:MAG TPA: hypothetical protein VFJ94_04075 [Intrasporangium sp.]|uniref:hypothetical protein n=1 Tax=Intrasporangium sp. TaxID=1925024 RepID=UPI002D797DF9|nr:hypothetical protein [Intrasporangium sp.]HET7397681.1 hypothetical protein [Intrasporangium sp.]